MTTPIIGAIAALRTYAPAYFLPSAPGSRTLRIPRPSMLSDRTWDGANVRALTLPTCMQRRDLSTWEQGYFALAEDYITASTDMVKILANDVAAERGMNLRQRLRFFPAVPSRSAGVSILLAFHLAGAVASGAEIIALTSTSFLVRNPHTRTLWGVEGTVELVSTQPLTPFNYKAYMEGTLWRGGASQNRNLVKAYCAARRAKDAVAMEILAGLYWNVTENVRIDEALGKQTG